MRKIRRFAYCPGYAGMQPREELIVTYDTFTTEI